LPTSPEQPLRSRDVGSGNAEPSVTTGAYRDRKESSRQTNAAPRRFRGNPPLPETVGDFTNALRGILFVLNEPSTLNLREAFRIVFRRKSQDGLMAIDGHNDRMNGCPARVIPRCYFNAEGHSTLGTDFRVIRVVPHFCVMAVLR
jgi:hypothetical protein